MCQTGGPRCYSHAKPAFDRVAAELAAADRDAKEKKRARDAIRRAVDAPAEQIEAAQREVGEADARNYEVWKRYKEAMGDLAASKKGERKIRENPDKFVITGSPAEDVISDGKFRRVRGQIIRKVRSGGDVSGMVAQTGDPVIDEQIAQAARNLADTPAACQETPDGWSCGRLYLDQSAEAWAKNLTGASLSLHQAKQRLHEAEEDVRLIAQSIERGEAEDWKLDSRRSNVEASRQWVAKQESNLVMCAIELREVQQREATEKR